MSPPAGKKHLILVIDDDEAVREVMILMLSMMAGLEGVGAGSAPKALEILLSREVDALVLDLLSGGQSGLDLYHKAVSLKPGLKGRVVLVSGRCLDPAMEKFCTEEGIPFLGKPFFFDDFVGAVTGLLGPRSAGSSRSRASRTEA